MTVGSGSRWLAFVIVAIHHLWQPPPKCALCGAPFKRQSAHCFVGLVLVLVSSRTPCYAPRVMALVVDLIRRLKKRNDIHLRVSNATFYPFSIGRNRPAALLFFLLLVSVPLHRFLCCSSLQLISALHFVFICPQLSNRLQSDRFVDLSLANSVAQRR